MVEAVWRFTLQAPRGHLRHRDGRYVWLQQVVDTVVARTVRGTQRYSDDYALLEADPTARRSVADTPPEPANHGPVFANGGGGPPQTATNSIAEKGRRLRRRRWGLTTVFAILVIGCWIDEEFVAPIFGLPASAARAAPRD